MNKKSKYLISLVVIFSIFTSIFSPFARPQIVSADTVNSTINSWCTRNMESKDILCDNATDSLLVTKDYEYQSDISSIKFNLPENIPSNAHIDSATLIVTPTYVTNWSNSDTLNVVVDLPVNEQSWTISDEKNGLSGITTIKTFNKQQENIPQAIDVTKQVAKRALDSSTATFVLYTNDPEAGIALASPLMTEMHYVTSLQITYSLPVNQAPTDVILSNTEIAENEPAGTTIGLLHATDPDHNFEFTYSLSGPDADKFRIAGNTLLSNGVFDLETMSKPTYDITIMVTDSDGGTYSKNFSIQVTDKANGRLSGLSVSEGALSPSFNPGTLSYSLDIPSSSSSFTVTPSLSDLDDTITVDGTTVSSGQYSNPITIPAGGSKTVTVAVADQVTSELTEYKIMVKRFPSHNALLSALTLSHGTITPNFNSSTLNYHTTVNGSVDRITVTPVAADSTATITVNGAHLHPGAASDPIYLVAGETESIDITVTAQNGTPNTYTVNVYRQSNNTNLQDLVISEGTLSPAFEKETLQYHTRVANTVTDLTVTPTLDDTKSSMTINDVAAQNGVPSQSITLSEGANPLTIIVTSEDGSTKTYQVMVYRESSNANLSNLALSNGALDPVFASHNEHYQTNVEHTDTSISVTPTVADSNAKVEVNGVHTVSGVPSTPIPLNVGNNTILVKVTAENGSSKTYTVTVNRARSSNTNLSSLVVHGGELHPNFNPLTQSYTTSVGHAVERVTVTPAVEDSTATVIVDGVPVTSGMASAPINLAIGETKLIEVMVTAQNGVHKTYRVDVYRQSNNANLHHLSISEGMLAPIFEKETLHYHATVGNATTMVNVIPTAEDANAIVKVNGVRVLSDTQSENIMLQEGSNTVQIVVTPEDGLSKTYTITVYRLSNNANVSQLISSEGTLDPTFNPAINQYHINVGHSVTNLTLTPTLADSKATLEVNGEAVGNGVETLPIPLNVGNNTIHVDVTAEDGTLKTYTITVNRARSNNADLQSLLVSDGTLDPSFEHSKLDYTLTVANPVSTISVTPESSDSAARITVNEAPVISSTASNPISLEIGTNTITIDVTAEDGTKKTYTLLVKRLSNNATLAGLQVSDGTITPAFLSDTVDYSVEVLNNVSTLSITPTVADVRSTVTVNGIPVASGVASSPISLHEGENSITILVTAEDGTVQAYTVLAHRISSNAALDNLVLNQGTIKPSFTSGTTNYEADVAYTVSSLTVTPTTANENASVMVNNAPVSNGQPSSSVPLNVGANTITIIVTAEDGVTTETYEITVNRANQPASPGPISEKITIDVEAGNLGQLASKVTVNRTKNSSGEVRDEVSFTEETTAETIKNLKNQNQQKAKMIIPDQEDIVDEVNINVPKNTTSQFADVGIDLEIQTPNVTVTIPKTSLQDFNKDLYFNLKPVKDLEIQQDLEDRINQETMVQNITKGSRINVLGRPMEIHTNMQSHPVTLTLPLRYVTGNNTNIIKNTVVFIDHSDGTKEIKSGKVITNSDGSRSIEFEIDAFSTFTPVYMEGWEDQLHEAYISGYSDNTFRPNAAVTRAQMAAMLSRNLGIQKSFNSVEQYTDVSSSYWAYNEIMTVKNDGIMIGSGDQFKPEASITRAQMATIVYRWVKNECEKDPSYHSECLSIKETTGMNYTDVADDYWAGIAIHSIKKLKIMEGYTNGTFKPEGNLTRAQAVKVLNRLFNREPHESNYVQSFKDVPTEHWAFREIEEAAQTH